MTREYIGVDLHKRFLQVCAISLTGDRLWEQRFPRTTDGIGRFAARVTADSAIAVEAMGPTWAFVDAVMPTTPPRLRRGGRRPARTPTQDPRYAAPP